MDWLFVITLLSAALIAETTSSRGERDRALIRIVEARQMRLRRRLARRWLD